MCVVPIQKNKLKTIRNICFNDINNILFVINILLWKKKHLKLCVLKN